LTQAALWCRLFLDTVSDTLRRKIEDSLLILIRNFTLLLALILAAALAAGAQTPSGDTPDAMVLIMSGLFPEDMGSIIYNSEVSDSDAKADLKEIARIAGWKVSNILVKTESNTPEAPKTTNIDFQVDSGAVEWAAGIIQVEPFAVALKRFDSIRVNYVLQGKMTFRSLRDYKNRYVDIDFSEDRGTYTYDITVKDRDFDKLGLPIVVTEPTKASKTDSSARETNSRGKIIWLAFFVALAAGGVVYVLSNRATRKTKGAE
jgi:hypothetical protein